MVRNLWQSKQASVVSMSLHVKYLLFIGPQKSVPFSVHSNKVDIIIYLTKLWYIIDRGELILLSKSRPCYWNSPINTWKIIHVFNP